MITIFSPDLTESHNLLDCYRINRIIPLHKDKVSLGWLAIITSTPTCNRVFRLTTSIHPDTKEPYLTWENIPSKDPTSVEVRKRIKTMKLLGVC